MREQVSELLKNNPGADYWEKLVLRFAEALLAQVDQYLRGIPVEEANLPKITVEEYHNMPGGHIELLHGIPTPKEWNIYIEGRRRLGWATHSEHSDQTMALSASELEAEMSRRRAVLRAKPFVPSQVPFPSGPPE